MISLHPALALIPLLGLAVDILAQALLCRLPLSIGHVRRQFVSFGLGLAAAVLALLLNASRWKVFATMALALLLIRVYRNLQIRLEVAEWHREVELRDKCTEAVASSG